ncbi:MAG: strawberry notch C-terminal domain-containing protein [Deltaproteobacteria bacterium]|nr:strawberry notch C-terminal domain-containing protein [Deltaproteobacteria bacterium]
MALDPIIYRKLVKKGYLKEGPYQYKDIDAIIRRKLEKAGYLPKGYSLTEAHMPRTSKGEILFPELPGTVREAAMQEVLGLGQLIAHPRETGERLKEGVLSARKGVTELARRTVTPMVPGLAQLQPIAPLEAAQEQIEAVQTIGTALKEPLKKYAHPKEEFRKRPITTSLAFAWDASIIFALSGRVFKAAGRAATIGKTIPTISKAGEEMVVATTRAARVGMTAIKVGGRMVELSNMIDPTFPLIRGFERAMKKGSVIIGTLLEKKALRSVAKAASKEGLKKAAVFDDVVAGVAKMAEAENLGQGIMDDLVDMIETGGRGKAVTHADVVENAIKSKDALTMTYLTKGKDPKVRTITELRWAKGKGKNVVSAMDSISGERRTFAIRNMQGFEGIQSAPSDIVREIYGKWADMQEDQQRLWYAINNTAKRSIEEGNPRAAATLWDEIAKKMNVSREEAINYFIGIKQEAGEASANRLRELFDLKGKAPEEAAEVVADALKDSGLADDVAEAMGEDIATAIAEATAKGVTPEQQAVMRTLGYTEVQIGNITSKGAQRVITDNIPADRAEISNAGVLRIRKAPSEQSLIEEAKKYKSADKYHQKIKEITEISTDKIGVMMSGEVQEVSQEVAENMDFSEPIEVSIFADGGIKVTDGHHRLAAAKKLGLKTVKVNVQAINAKGKDISSLISSQQIEEAPAEGVQPKRLHRTAAEAKPPELLTKQQKLVNAIMLAMENDTMPTSPKGLRELATERLGDDFDQDTDIDMLYDALEGAAHLHQRRLKPVTEDIGSAIVRAVEAEDSLVNRTRTLEVSKLQQFSTPMPLAEATAYAADVNPKEVILEPSAGTGSLVEPFYGKDNIINLNEIDPNRVAILRSIGHPMKGNKLNEGDALLLTDKADIVVTNPPWGAFSTGKYATTGAKAAMPFKINDVSERFVVAALKNNLNDGGRLSAIMPTNIVSVKNRSTGEWTSAGGPFRKWLRDNHTIRAIIQSPPGAYAKRGTTVDSVLLVVDKGKGIAPRPEPIIAVGENAPTNFDEYLELIKPLSGGGSHARIPGERLPGEITPAKVEPIERPAEIAEAIAPEGIEREPVTAEGVPTEAVGIAPRREVEPTRPPEEPTRPTPDVPAGRESAVGEIEVAPEGTRPVAEPEGRVRPEQPRAVADVVSPETGALEPGRAEGTQAVEPTREDVSIPPIDDGVSATAPKPDTTAEKAATRTEVGSSEVFTNYTPRSGERRSPHPGTIVEARTLAGTPYPDLTYTPHRIVDDALNRKVISDEQFDDIRSALQANAEGHGILIANDVGTGKSRIAAGIIIDKLETGRSKRILVSSEKAGHIEDLADELQIVYSGKGEGGQVIRGKEIPYEVIKVKDFPAAARPLTSDEYEPLPLIEKGIYMADMSDLRRFKDALRQVGIDGWVADEAHKFKNPASQVGIAWSILYEDLRASGKGNEIVYLTATPAQNIDDLQQLYGLGEWRPDTFNDWVQVVTGEKTPEEVVGEAKIAEKERQKKLEKAHAQGIPLGKEADEATAKAQWGAAASSTFDKKVSSAEMEQIIREFKRKGKFISKDLWRGGVDFNSAEVTIPPERTAQYDKEIMFMRDIENVFQQYKGANKGEKGMFSIRALLQNHNKRLQFEIRLDEAIRLAKESLAKGKQPVISLISVSPTEAERGNLWASINAINTVAVDKLPDKTFSDPTDIPEALLAKQELFDRLESEIEPLPSPIEKIQEAFGKENVAIITGQTKPEVRQLLMAEFQGTSVSGESQPITKKVAVISGAGKTGISLHHVTEATGAAKGQRHLIVADYEWSATEFKQSLGRVDRTGQLTSPEVTMITTGTAGETKFVATIANRMKSLGALSKGAAESTELETLAAFEFGGTLDNKAMRETYKDLPKNLKEWFISNKFKESDDRPKMETKANVREFLLEFQLMPTEPANKIMDAFLKKRVEILKRQDKLAETLGITHTEKKKGEILRSTDMAPDLVLHEVQDEPGSKFGILEGVITDKIGALRNAVQDKLGADTDLKREYLTFTGKENKQISGLRVRRGLIKTVSEYFGRDVAIGHTPESALQDLRAGDTIDLSEGLNIKMRPSDKRLQVKGVKQAARKRVMDSGAQFSPVGAYFFVPEENLQKFLEAYPIKEAQAPAVPETPEPTTPPAEIDLSKFTKEAVREIEALGDMPPRSDVEQIVREYAPKATDAQVKAVADNYMSNKAVHDADAEAAQEAKEETAGAISGFLKSKDGFAIRPNKKDMKRAAETLKAIAASDRIQEFTESTKYLLGHHVVTPETVLNSQGPEGRIFTRELRMIDGRYKAEAGRVIYDVVLPIRKELTDLEWENMVDVLEDKANPINEKVENAAEALRTEYDKVADEWIRLKGTIRIYDEYGKPHDIPFKKRENYFQHSYPKEMFKDKEFMDEIVAGLAEEMDVSEVEARKIIEQARMDKTGMRMANLEMARTTDMPGYKRDAGSVIKYFTNAWKRVELSRSFGPKYQKFDKMTESLTEAGADPILMREVFGIYTGNIPMSEGLRKHVVPVTRQLKRFQILTKMGRATIANFFEGQNIPMALSWKSNLKGIFDWRTKEGRRQLDITGSVLHDAIRHIGSGAEKDWVFEIGAPGFTMVERNLRRVAAASGGRWFKDNEAMLRKAIKKGNKRKEAQARRVLKRWGFDPDDVLENPLGLPENDRRMREGMNRTADFTQKAYGALDIPPGFMGPYGNAITQFKSWTLQQAKFMVDTAYQAGVEAFTRGNFMPLARYLVALGVFVGTGEAVNELRSWLYHRERTGIYGGIVKGELSKKEIAKLIAKDFLSVTSLGQMSIILDALEYHDPFGAVLGPLAGDISALERIVRKPSTTAKEALKRAGPLGAPAASLLFPYRKKKKKAGLIPIGKKRPAVKPLTK